MPPPCLPCQQRNISCVSVRGRGLTEWERNAGCSGTHGGDRDTKPRGVRAAHTVSAFEQGSGRVHFVALGVETRD